MRRTVATDTVPYTLTFDSLSDLISVNDTEAGRSAIDSHARAEGNSKHGLERQEFVYGPGLHSASDVLTMAKAGWSDDLSATLDVAEDVVSTIEREQSVPVFLPVLDVAGCEVDMGRYLSGEPECMVDYPLAEIVKAGKVITLVASIGASAAFTSETLIKRGQSVTALALALTRCGYAVEIWADWTTAKTHTRRKPTSRILVCLKSADDTLDAERLLYALAHPSMLRSLIHCGAHGLLPKNLQSPVRGYGMNPVETFPEGTIYLPTIYGHSDDSLDAPTFVLAKLRELGIVAD